MRLLILHLSDIHLEGKETYSRENMEGICKSIKLLGEFEAALVIVSGDLVYSGKKYQYNTSWHFLNNIRNMIKNEYHIDTVEMAIVPGNHDMDYDEGLLSHNELEEIFKNDFQNEKLDEEHNKMKAFYWFANGLDCFDNKKQLISVKEIEFGNVSLKVNLINTAVYSIKEEDQGFHYITESELCKLDCNNEKDFIFSIMHHPHHWYHSSVKKKFEQLLYQNSDIVFVGHEHYSSSMDIESDEWKVKVLSGGQLSNRGNWTNSEFYAGVLDSETRKYNYKRLKWNVDNKIYVQVKDETRILSKNRINKFGLKPKNNYIIDLFKDKKYMISNDFSDYYVFPRLEEIIPAEKRIEKEIQNMQQFVEELEETKRMIIVGRNDSGKSSLIKQVMKELFQTKFVLFLNSSNIMKQYDKSIKNSFHEMYSDDNIKYEKFKQIPIEEKVLIIDDTEVIDESLFQSFISSAEGEFGYIIYTMSKIVELDIKERIRRGELEENYVKYKIQPFYSDKRKELVSKVVRILVKKDDESQENIIELLCEALSKQKKLFHMDPDFIVQFTKYYCNNIGETVQNDGEIFSKVFEANLVSLITPFAKQINVDKILIILDKIAYEMHVNKEYPMSQDAICTIIRKYNEDYDSEIDYVDFLTLLTSADIMRKVASGYKFCEKSYLAYFVAREIKRKCIEEADFSEFEKAVEYSCFDINADIILFVTYITDNLNLIRKLLDRATEYTYEWDEFTTNPITIPYLSDVKQLEVKQVEESDKEHFEEEMIESEKEMNLEDEFATDLIYNYTEDELTLMQRMIRAISLLVIVSRILPSFEHMMKKEDKDKCVELIYSMPLRIFNRWAWEVEDAKTELIQEIKEIHEWDYRKEKIQLEDFEALNYIRWESISLLLEMMNSSIGYATKSNTYRFLDSFSYSDSTLYRVAHLMGLDKRDNVSEFINEIEKLYKEQKQQLTKLIIKRVARHYILTSKKLQRNQVQRLNAKLWNDNLNQTALLIQKERNAKKEQ